MSPVKRKPDPRKKVASVFQEAEIEIKGHSLEDNKRYLDSLDHTEESSLSDAESDGFEDVLPPPPAKKRKLASEDEESEKDEEMDWENAIDDSVAIAATTAHEPTGDLELTLDQIHTHTLGSLTNPHGTKKGPSKIERAVRYYTHCLHVQSLMYHNFIRNTWLADAQVQKILVDVLPAGCKSEFQRWKDACAAAGVIIGNEVGSQERTTMTKDKHKDRTGKMNHKPKPSPGKKHKNQRDWGERADVPAGVPQIDPLLRLLKMLSAFWKKRFLITAPGLRKQGYKDLSRLEEEVKAQRKGPHDPEEHGERIKNIKELRELARRGEGSRDLGAQLFTAMLRGLGLEARLVASLQPVGFGWNKSEDANPPKRKKSDKATPTKTMAVDSEVESVKDASSAAKKKKLTKVERPESKPAKLPGKNTKARLAGNRDAPIDLSEEDSDLSEAPESDDEDDDASVIDVTPNARSSKKYDRDLPFPIYWTEVLSPISNTWVAVDPLILNVITSDLENHVVFQPLGARAERAKQVYAYLVAFANDGSAKDVTVRYLKKRVWPGKTKGVRIPLEKIPIYNKRNKIIRYEEQDFFKQVMSCYAPRVTKKRSKADEIEDALDLKPIKPTPRTTHAKEESLQGYKNSAEFVLERHLRREEALLPDAKPVKQFLAGKGETAKAEDVYLRSDVAICRTTESWHKEGREVKPGEKALKLVPVRAVTLIRKREIEEAERETGEKPKQAMYSRAQTDWIIPPPIQDGVIPKNAFGNMDVYVPTMVPKGAVHLKLKGSAKICKRLGIDFAEAVTGFEFGNKRAVPICTGVVVAQENRDLVVSAWRTDAEEKQKREDAKREKLALGTWKKMLTGLRIIERVRQEYGADADAHIAEAIHPMTAKKKGQQQPRKTALKSRNETKIVNLDSDEDQFAAGGFVPDDDNGEGMAGGFLRDGDEKAVKHEKHDAYEGGGGFLLEDHDEAPSGTKGKIAELGIERQRKPISLQSLHQTLNSPYGSDLDDDQDDGSTSQPPEAVRSSKPATKARAAGKSKAPTTTAANVTTKVTSKASAKTAAKTTPKSTPKVTAKAKQPSKPKSITGTRSQESTVKSNESEDDQDATATKISTEGDFAKRPVRRGAAKRSMDAVRSHYFEHDEDDEVEEGSSE